MSNIDKRALREAAEKATPGVWVYLPKNTSIEYDYGSDDSQGSIAYMDSGDFTQKQTDLNGAFIAAANPATVLALLDELEAAEKQIAELEAREMREDGNQFLVVRYPGKAPVIKHCAGDLEGFLRQLLEYDPMATIDIITHRYYGVGGQLVQDADEYLQMMAAAAGKGE